MKLIYIFKWLQKHFYKKEFSNNTIFIISFLSNNILIIISNIQKTIINVIFISNYTL